MIRNGGTPEVSLEDGLKAVRIGLAAETVGEDRRGQSAF
jgi:hypothetical protein